MAITTVTDQTTTLLRQTFAEPKIRGTPAPQVEAPAVLQSIAATLLLNPRASLYVAHLARNGLLAAVTDEIAQIDAVSSDVRDLGNITYNITDTSSLQTAKTSLLALESQQRISSSVGAFKIFDSSISSFLNKQLAPNVKAPGATSLVRPGQEAADSLSSDFASLKTKHSDVLDRLYALAVGVQNFLSSPLGSIIGAQTASRSRADIDSIIEEIEQDPSGASSRDFVNRLITNRAALRSIGTAPDISTPVLDSVDQLPTGYAVTASTHTGFIPASTIPELFFFTGGDALSVTVGAANVTRTTSSLVQALNQPAVLGTAIPPGGVVIQPNYNFFIQFLAAVSQSVDFTLEPDGTYTHPDLGTNWSGPSALYGGSFSKVYRVPLNTSMSPVTLSMAAILSLINSTIGVIGQAVEMAQAGSNRILIFGLSNAPNNYVKAISIAISSTEPILSGGFTSYTFSAHDSLGFTSGQTGRDGTTAELMLVSLNILYSSILTVTKNTNGSLTLKTLSNVQGTPLLFSGNIATTLGLLSTAYTAVSDRVTFSGTVLGVPTNPVNPIGLMNVGDSFKCPTGSSTIKSISSTGITLSSAVPTFIGSVTITSALYVVWLILSASIQTFLQSWAKTSYATDLSKLDATIAVLKGQATPAQRNVALSMLAGLRAKLVSLSALLSDSTSIPPPGSGIQELQIVQSILSTFDERKYDRAKDFFLRCKIQDIFQMDYQTLSYGGNLMKASSNVARSDVRFVNVAKDEGGDVLASQPRTGLT